MYIFVNLAAKSRGQQLVLGHISRMHLADGVSVLAEACIILYTNYVVYSLLNTTVHACL